MFLEEEDQLRRLRMPRNEEVLGIVEQMLGASRMKVSCKDNKIRICRIPGKIKRRIWIKEGDVVIVKPWAVQSGEKGDIVWRYTRPQVDRLLSQGVI
ncbi:MAG: translation initiation factor eIF-1A [Candidatus Hydrothermarchaeota archaeon]|nr:translation initiation factor eIF-1A [Candidatus Hydrothermarchaeota archaeon]